MDYRKIYTCTTAFLRRVRAAIIKQAEAAMNQNAVTASDCFREEDLASAHISCWLGES